MLPDVAGPGGAEDRVGRRVADDVGVGVPERAALGRHRHPAEHERPALDQPVQVVADADTPRGGARCSTGARAIEIAGGRNLDVRRVARDDVHAVTRALGQHGLVGRSLQRCGRRDGGAEHVAPERLRRLREKDLLARQRFDDHARPPRASPYR